LRYHCCIQVLFNIRFISFHSDCKTTRPLDGWTRPPSHAIPIILYSRYTAAFLSTFSISDTSFSKTLLRHSYSILQHPHFDFLRIVQHYGTACSLRYSFSCYSSMAVHIHTLLHHSASIQDSSFPRVAQALDLRGTLARGHCHLILPCQAPVAHTPGAHTHTHIPCARQYAWNTAFGT
jgi:hypothetical protein